ncbi:MAG TPA: hypothetical protein VMZ66_04630 [Aeromicrobium sp.]|nr:hypothetical protein [Aeromicrobium sp.]
MERDLATILGGKPRVRERGLDVGVDVERGQSLEYLCERVARSGITCRGRIPTEWLTSAYPNISLAALSGRGRGNTSNDGGNQRGHEECGPKHTQVVRHGSRV